MHGKRTRLGQSVRTYFDNCIRSYNSLYCRHNFGNNDVAGNFSLTLIDVLDTFIVLGDREGFNDAVRKVTEWVSFDVNTKPQVFETTIRVLGGLLSAHIFASNSNHTFYLPWYRGELLNLAQDLGERMLPAFSTPTGIPYARVIRNQLLYISLSLTNKHSSISDMASHMGSP